MSLGRMDLVVLDELGYLPFSQAGGALLFHLLSAALIELGHWWYSSALKDGGDTLNGIVVMVIGFVVGLGLLYYNFTKTNLLYGVGGTAFQLVIFSWVAAAAIGMLPLLLLAGLAMGRATRVVIVD